MIKQIIHHLLENHGFVSSVSLCNLFHQPVSLIERELRELNHKYPDLLIIQKNNGTGPSTLYVKIAPQGEALAKGLLLI